MFIYVFGEDAKNKMLANGYMLLRGDITKGIYCFVNHKKQAFALDIQHVVSDSLVL